MDERFTARFWDERYRSATFIWSGNPSPQLVQETAGLEPGAALDAGCGEGADTHRRSPGMAGHRHGRLRRRARTRRRARRADIADRLT